MFLRNKQHIETKRQLKTKKLGIIAGSGSLPASLAMFCLKENIPFAVFALKGHADLSLLPEGISIHEIRIGAVGKTFKLLEKEEVEEIVLIGGVRRPSLVEMCPDFEAIRFFTKLKFKSLGDDTLLRSVIKEVERRGFKVKGIHEYMPSLLAPKGILGKHSPSKTDLTDMKRGFEVAKLLGQADVGQSVIVQQNLVLSVEGIEGTGALIERTKYLKRSGDGGVLVKTKKPQQEERVDLPTIGPDTVKMISKAGLKGIAVEANNVLIVDLEKTVKKADELNVFIVGIEDDNREENSKKNKEKPKRKPSVKKTKNTRKTTK